MCWLRHPWRVLLGGLGALAPLSMAAAQEGEAEGAGGGNAVAEALAATDVPPPGEGDSAVLLNEILNYTGMLEVLFGDGAGAADVSGVVPMMLGTFSAFAAGGVALVMIYMWSVAVMHTAWEGEALGQRYSTLWTPIRSVMAVAFVAPFPGMGGLSVMMAMILALVSVSIQGANMLYSDVLDYFVDNNASIMQMSDQDGRPANRLVTTALLGEMCMDHHNVVSGAHERTQARGAGLRRLSRTESFDPGSGQLTIEYGSPTVGGPKVCGSIEVSCPTDARTGSASPICATRMESVLALVGSPAISDLASQIIESESGVSVEDAQSGVNQAVTAYGDVWRGVQEGNANISYDEASGIYSLSLTPEEEAAIESFVAQAQSDGWLAAGKWYWNLSAKSHEQALLSKSTLDVHTPDADNVPHFEDEFQPKVRRLETYLGEVTIDRGAVGGIVPVIRGAGDEGDQSDLEGAMSSLWSNAIGTDLHAMTGLLTQDNDPIRTLAGYGQSMIGVGTAIMGAAALGKMAEATGQSGLLSTLSLGGSAGAGALAGFVASLAAIAGGWLIGVGGLLAYYIPVIPLMYWVLAILGWVTAVIGSLLAAPLWAASHAVPEGEGFAGRYALQGWQLLLNVVLRPILLTIGVIVAIFVMKGIAFFALDAYVVFNESMVNSTATTAIVGFLFTNLIMVILVITISHKAHELIYSFADEVMRWIGFGVQPLGSVQNEGEIRSQARAGTATTERMVQAGVGRVAGQGGGSRAATGGGGGFTGGGGRSGGGTQSGGSESQGNRMNPRRRNESDRNQNRAADD